MKKPVVHQILRTWWCLLVIDVVTDIIDEPFQHALSQLGLVVHRRMVVLRFYGGQIRFTVTDRLNELKNRQKRLKKKLKNESLEKKAVGSVLKCEEHSHHQDGVARGALSLWHGNAVDSNWMNYDM